MPSYDVIKEYGVSPDDVVDEVNIVPAWVICIIRLKYPTTFSRADKKSFSTQFPDGVEVRGSPLIITGDCISVTAANSKATHISQMNATLLPSDSLNYLAEIIPGDHVFVWMTTSQEQADEVVSRIQDGKNANRFLDGLKFVGRVHSIRKQILQAPGGIRQTRYNLNGIGFSEFDATQFYDEHLAANDQALGQTFARLGIDINKIISEQGEGLDVNTMVPALMDLILGRGLPPNRMLPTSDGRTNATAGLEAPYSYIVPSAVGTLLGKKSQTKPGGALAASDLYEMVWGIQHYNDSDEVDLPFSSTIYDSQVGQLFQPEGTKDTGNRRFTGSKMLGTFPALPPQFTNKSVWSLLNEFLNPAVNEMFTCLRVNPEGLVVPTLVLRQLPFNSPLYSGEVEATKFLELPRWKFHPVLVKSADIGRSDSARINFVHVYGNSGPIASPHGTLTYQLVQAPPIRDDLDIARSGLRPHMMTVNCALQDTVKAKAKDWMTLLTDFIIDQHLLLTGVLEVQGVSAPICPGDNIEWDGAVYHIESVTHRCSIAPGGQREFSTTLALTHGVSADPKTDDLSLFAGMEADDLRTYEAPRTQESGNEENDATITRSRRVLPASLTLDDPSKAPT